MDIFERIQQNEGGPLGQYRKRAKGYFMFPKLEGEIEPYMTFQGKKMLTWTFNNYLGLANDPEVRKADAEAAVLVFLPYPHPDGLNLPPLTARMNRNTCETCFSQILRLEYRYTHHDEGRAVL